MAIYKAVYSIVVLAEFDNERDAERALTCISMAELGNEIEEGAWIGTFCSDKLDMVPVEKVEAELKMIGNDGTFFSNET